MNRSRWILVAVFVFAFAAAVIQSVRAGRPSNAAFDPRVATTNSQDRGARALYLWLRGMGHEMHSHRRPYTDLDAEVLILFVLDPTQEVTPTQADALFEWVHKGGILFIAPGESAELLARLEEYVDFRSDPTEPSDVPGDRAVRDDHVSRADPQGRWRYRELTPDERGQYDYPIRDVAFRYDRRIMDPTEDHSILLAREEGGLVAEIYEEQYVGAGMVILFADEEMLTNRGIEKANNVELLASLMNDWVDGMPIWFDDYHHGERPGGSLLVYLAQRRPGLFALALGLAGVFGVIGYGRALVVVPDTARRRRRSSGEFVDALGQLYKQSRAVQPAWDALSEVGKRLLGGAQAGRHRLGETRWRERSANLEQALDPGGVRTERDLVRLASAVASAFERPHEDAGRIVLPAARPGGATRTGAAAKNETQARKENR